MVICDYDQGDTDSPMVSTDIAVTDPVTHYSCGNGRYTTYSVVLESNDFCFSLPRSMVRRRFSEFSFLRRLLKTLQPNVEPPALHSKNFFKDRFSFEFILQRRQQLERFMQHTLSQPLYLSNKALHLFLQTNLPMREIEAQVSGQQPILPLETTEDHLLISDSSMSTASSGDSECQTCDYVDRSSSCCSNPKCASLLSTNHEAFVTSMPFLPCSNDIHIMSKESLVPKGLCHSTDTAAAPSNCSSSLTVPQSVCDSCASNSKDCNHLSKRNVSFADTVSVIVL